MNNITKFKIFEKIYKIRKIEIYKLLFSIILSFMMFSYTNKLVYKLLPTREVIISSINKEKKDTYISITQNDETLRFYDLKDIFNKNMGLKEQVDENKNYIIYSDNPETKISFKLKEIPNNEIIFKNLGMNEINVKVGNKSKILNMPSIVEEGKLYSYFPFQNSKLYFLYSVGIYLLFTGIVYFILNFSICFFNRSKKNKIKNFLLEYSPKKVFLLLYLIIFTCITIAVLGNFIPNTYFIPNTRFVIYDQQWYWVMGTYLKNLEFSKLLNQLTFRGYFSYFPMALAQVINSIFKIKFNEFWSFYMINNFFIVLFLSYIIPEIYNKLTRKKVKNYQILILFFIFSFFWRGVYYSVLTDMFGIVMFSWSILIFLNYLDDKKNISAFLSGILIAIASLTRANYSLGVYVIIFIFILKYGFKISKLKKLKSKFFVYFFLGMILISFPQAVINFKQNHIGIFPYDEKGSYARGLSLTEVHINDTLDKSLVFSMFTVFKPMPDNTALKLKNNFTKETININQMFSLFINNPIDTGVLMVKKLFYSIDLKTPEMYPPSKYRSHTRTYIFSFFNYFVFLTGIYLLKDKKNREKFFSKKELQLGSILIVLFVLPQIVMFSIEWRFFMIFYLIAYYNCAFIFSKAILDNNFDNFKYLNFIILGEILFFVLSSFYYDSIV